MSLRLTGKRMVKPSTIYRMNIFVANVISEILKTSFGPRGMHKMVIDQYGNLTVTNDGVSVLKDLTVEHPIAKLMVELAKTQSKEVGDGTKKVVILVGNLLKKAEKLLNQKIHPATIVEGYSKAMKKALELTEKLAIPFNVEDKNFLKKIAKTALNSRIQYFWDELSELAVQAASMIMEKHDGKIVVDVKNRVLIRKKEGESIKDSKIVQGVIINKEIAHPAMPKKMENAKIILTNQKLYLEKKYESADAFVPTIHVDSPQKMREFLGEKLKLSKNWLDKIKASGANVLISLVGIERSLEDLMAKEGILAVRRADKEAFNLLPFACGGKIVGNLEDLTPECLGYASLVEERKVGGGARADWMVFVEGCKNPKAVSILLRGGSWEVVDESEKALKNALNAIANAMETGKVLVGGGAIEVELALHLKKYAVSLGGKEQLAVEAFAEALEEIPKILVLNAGLNPAEVFTNIQAQHEKGNPWVGFEALSKKVKNMFEEGIFEPFGLVTQTIKSATETANLILRIDRLIRGFHPKGAIKKI